MNAETIRAHCLSKNGVEETQPFGINTVVYKLGGKMFLLVALDAVPLQFNAKCDPDAALELREQYNCVLPGYHMSKKHWNTIIVDGTVSDKVLLQWIDDSYNLVYESLPKKIKSELAGNV
jgi:predicted DNA-binding protein (MmcQ/YjbR family)